MKGIFLFCTRLWVYLLELPLMLILSITIHYHDKAEGLFGFYPLEIALSAGIIFIAVYFFRAVFVTTDEVRTLGLFSSREHELIKRDSTLILTLRPKRKLNVDLWVNDDTPAFDWLKGDANAAKELRVFHGVAIAGKRSAARILTLFSATEEQAKAACEEDGYSFENESIRVSCERKNEIFEIRVRILTTLE